LAGRIGVGLDLNPLAYVLTGAKVDPPLPGEIVHRLNTLEENYSHPDLNEVPDEIKMLFDGRGALPQLVFLRNNLDINNRIDRYILGTACGLLHGNARQDGTSRYFSISMPNTFSMSPAYVRRFIRSHNLKKNPIDVFDALRTRAVQLLGKPSSHNVGQAKLGNARFISRTTPEIARKSPPRLIVTSPPYLNVVRYGKFNWIRLWLLRKSAAEADRKCGISVERTDRKLNLDDTHGDSKYSAFMESVLKGLSDVSADDAVLALVIGDVEKRTGESINLSNQVLQIALEHTSLRHLTTIEDRLPDGEKVTRIWGAREGNATKTDRILILYKGRRPTPRHSNPQSIIEELAKTDSTPIESNSSPRCDHSFGSWPR